MKPLVVLILVLAAGGLAFSGYLTYQELFASAPTCAPVGEPGSALGAPPCVYGFVMYLAIAGLAVAALVRGRARRAA